MSPHRLLDELRKECVAYHRQVTEIAASLGLDDNTSWEERVTLRRLMSGPKSLGQLSATRAIAKSAVAAGICKLEQNGYVQRRHRPSHAQALVVELTEKGRKLAQRSLDTMICNCYQLSLVVDMEACQRALETLRQVNAAIARIME